MCILLMIIIIIIIASPRHRSPHRFQLQAQAQSVDKRSAEQPEIPGVMEWPGTTPSSPPREGWLELLGDDRDLAGKRTQRREPVLDSLLKIPVVCSSDQLEDTKPRQGFGGKQACIIQRNLRKQCLDQGIWEIDLTETDVDWRSLLRAQPPGMRSRLLGLGIIKFTFRLLQLVRDSNYAKLDSGERHVFEITRVDGSTAHLHFHKNGKMDDPIVHQPRHLVAEEFPVASSTDIVRADAQNEVLFSQKDLFDTNLHYLIGRSEAVLALNEILGSMGDRLAVDISDGMAFDWRRWLLNLSQGHDLVGTGVVRVFACRWHKIDPPLIAVCRIDGTYATLNPHRQTYSTREGRDSRFVQEADQEWQRVPMFQAAAGIDQTWMQARNERFKNM
jgi:hypothetical protein